ncbi:MAG: hypothetical protein KA371_07895 [Acidobacteria bacterium]|jgi:hypothetical protein|nr:hypothetical protein [Acidobacteriota bacterium]
MRAGHTILMVMGLTAMLAACGKAPEEKAADAMKEAASNMVKAGEDMAKAGEAAAGALTEGAAPAAGQAAKGMEDFAKAMQGMAAAMGGANGGKVGDPVSFRDLQTAFPEVPGWTMAKPKGERMTAPVAFSQTEVRYQNGDQSIEVKIVDSAFNQILVAPWAMFLTSGYEKETDDGYEKSTTVAGNPGFEKWNEQSKDGELNLVVAKRFLVSVEGDRLTDVKQLHEFASKIDFGKLGALGAAAATK